MANQSRRAARVSVLVAAALFVPVTVAHAESLQSQVHRADTGLRRDALDQLRSAGRISPDEYALARARSLFDLAVVRKSYGAVRRPKPGQASSFLARVAALYPRLAGDERREATTILSRPTDHARDPVGDGYQRNAHLRRRCFRWPGRPKKNPGFCVHWAANTRDRPPSRDANHNKLPDQVEIAVHTLRHVYRAEVQSLGYRRPLPDRGRKARPRQGPNKGFDLYMLDLGADGLFGYCTADPSKKKRLRAAAYCAIDNDFSEQQYPGASPLGSLQVTLAHEFFHAIQFAYDFGNNDEWLREGTAAWMEDEVFDDVNSNYGYLPASPREQPEVPLDGVSAGGATNTPTDQPGTEYGAWIFWRFLSEYYGSPDVIRRVWQAFASPASRGDALNALTHVLSARQPVHCLITCGTTGLPDAFAEFAFWNVASSNLAFWDYVDHTYNLGLPRWYELSPPTYEEAAGYRQGRPPLPTDGEYLLDDDNPATGARQLAIDHLSSRSIAILLLGGPGRRLKLSLDLPPESDGARASLAFVTYSGQAGAETFELNPDGDASPVIGDLLFAVVTLSNVSGRSDSDPFRYEGHLLP